MMPSGPTPNGTKSPGPLVTGKRRSGLETWISLLIFGILAIVIGMLFRAQMTFNPAVEVAIGLQSPPPEPKGPVDASETLGFSPPPGVNALGPVETFQSQTLSDKINGKAELYLKAGFVRLAAQRYRVASEPGVWMEMSVFEMTRPQAAYSVYSLQRRENGKTLDGLPQAYVTENALFLHQGPYYLEIIGSQASEMVAEMALKLAHRFNEAHPETETGEPADKTLFPKPGLTPNSIQLIPANAFGYHAFNDVLVASYRKSGTELTSFISRRSSPEDAKRLKMDYGQFLIEFGATPVDRLETVQGAAVYDLMGYYEIILVIDRYIAGIHEAEDLLIAEQLAIDMAQRIRQVIDEREHSQ